MLPVFQFSKIVQKKQPLSWTIILVVGIFLISACGKKGPPVPLTYVTPPVVENLAIEVKDNIAILKWPIPAGEGEKENTLAGFYVYMSKRALIEDDCPDCPLQYEKVADIRFEDSSSIGIYEAPLEKGFRYSFQVSVYTENGYEGERSSAVGTTY